MTKQQVQTVIDNLTRVMPKDGGKLDMTQCRINTCGSPMCHAGWYALSKYKDISHIMFDDGASKMAKDLGFETYHQLQIWAQDNPKIWGNKYGYAMFSSNDAFPGAESLQDIINHWKGVKSRLCD